jgi:hypothetical protein
LFLRFDQGNNHPALFYDSELSITLPPCLHEI